MQKLDRAGLARDDFSVVSLGPNRPTKPKHAPPAPLLVFPGAPTGVPGAPTGVPGFRPVGGGLMPTSFKMNLQIWPGSLMSRCQHVRM